MGYYDKKVTFNVSLFYYIAYVIVCLPVCYFFNNKNNKTIIITFHKYDVMRQFKVI